MDATLGHDVVCRYKGNPLISLDDMGFQCSDILNAGTTRVGSEYVMLITVEALEGRCRIYTARSKDGKNFWISPKPLLAPSANGQFHEHESFGIRDPRITYLDDTYYISYVADGDHGLRLALARTDDFETVERLSFLSQVDYKNGVLFPAKIGGKYALLNRPNDGGSIWIDYSSDLEFWGSPGVVMTPRWGFWDANTIGAAGLPIEIDQGWLLIYYGVKNTSAGPLVRLGAAVLDREDPTKVLSRSNIPILSPRERYERIGDIPNVIFSCAVLLDDDGMVNIYYGASDSCICLGQASLEDILSVCKESEKEF